ncbi:class I SAM-dependent methyltransferase [candidate division KSB1 bacterium]|nr:class I SAM-dependent methyltransferase [candidate division KSB1 bacterium]
MKQNPFNIFTDEYENWFIENELLFQSELLALKQVVPIDRTGIEIGVGSGIFAEKLHITWGIDPSVKMLELARRRNITVCQAVAEHLPCPAKIFDFVVFITSICFIDDLMSAIKEAYRILKNNGEIIIAFIDRESSFGKLLQKNKSESKFYKFANFYSVKEIGKLIESGGFKIEATYQTLTQMNPPTVEQPLQGYGRGSFVIIKGRK